LKLPIVGVAILMTAAACAGAGAAGTAWAKLPPLRDPVFLNIGFVCQWQERCIEKQRRAMKKAIAYTRKYKPPAWKIHLCNRRAVQRRSGRVDWISYNNCIRNPAVQRSTVSRASR
jgi:hypothetical protein